MITAISQLELNGLLMSTSGTSLIVGSQISVYQSQTGSFITTGQTGAFGGGGSTPTGNLTGAFYPLIGNPSNFITSGTTGILLQMQLGLNKNPSYTLDVSGIANFTNNNSINIVQITGNYTGYQQLNLQNFSNGTLASSDLVCTNNLGNETGYYVDLGINSSTYTGQYVGSSGDTYLYSSANDFYFGNVTSGKRVYLFAGNIPYQGSQVCATIFNNKFGLNNINPQYQLDVSGSGNFVSGIYINGVNISSTYATITNLGSTGNTLQLSVNSLNSWTGNSTGLYYPRTSNPSGFILPSQTGIFITTGMTGAFGGGGSTPTGQLTGAFYPLSNNPSGYTTFSSFANLTWGITTNWTSASNAIEDKKILILTGNTTLNITGLYNGWCGVLETIQSGISSSGYNLTLPSGTKVMASGNGLATLTMQSGAVDFLGFIFDGSKLFCNIGNQFN